MAPISHIRPMFLLILSLFFLPTLLAKAFDFDNCKDGGIQVFGVDKFIEQGRKSFNVTCSTDTVLTKGFLLAVVKQGYSRGLILNIQPYRLCGLITCPISPGIFVITFRKLYPVGIKGDIRTHIVLNGGPDKDVKNEVQADGSLCLNIYEFYKH